MEEIHILPFPCWPVLMLRGFLDNLFQCHGLVIQHLAMEWFTDLVHSNSVAWSG